MSYTVSYYPFATGRVKRAQWWRGRGVLLRPSQYRRRHPWLMGVTRWERPDLLGPSQYRRRHLWLVNDCNQVRESRPVRTLTVQKETSVVNDCNQVRESRPVRTLTVQKETSVVNDCNQVRERSPLRPSLYRIRHPLCIVVVTRQGWAPHSFPFWTHRSFAFF